MSKPMRLQCCKRADFVNAWNKGALAVAMIAVVVSGWFGGRILWQLVSTATDFVGYDAWALGAGISVMMAMPFLGIAVLFFVLGIIGCGTVDRLNKIWHRFEHPETGTKEMNI